MGALMGSLVGLGMGFIFGGWTLITRGPGPNGFLRSLGQYMFGSAATFGFFMSIGAAIRTDEVRRLMGERQAEVLAAQGMAGRMGVLEGVRRVEMWKRGEKVSERKF